MTSIFDIIQTDLRSLSLHTELLESCDWDESIVEKFHADFLEVSESSINLPLNSLQQFVDVVMAEMSQRGWTYNQRFILDKIIKLHATEIVEIMKNEINQKPSFFEFITLLSLVIFRDEKVELSIIEVGLGGRLDSTNVIDPTLSVISQISKDHTEILGKTIKKITAEKAGIIKKEIPVVTSNQTKNAFEVIKLTAKKLD